MSPQKKQEFKHHYGYNDCTGNRIEWFSNLGPKSYKKGHLALKTGKFRVTRKDNAKGHRYFINDLRDLSVVPNCVVLFNQADIDLVVKHEIKPAYTRDNLNVYYFGEYNHPNMKKKLIITADDIREENVLA